MYEGRQILDARRDGDRIALTLDSGTRRVDHVVLATGYRIDVDKMSILDPLLRGRIARHGDLPVLSAGFKSSVCRAAFYRRFRRREFRAAASIYCRCGICGAGGLPDRRAIAAKPAGHAPAPTAPAQLLRDELSTAGLMPSESDDRHPNRRGGCDCKPQQFSAGMGCPVR